MVAFAERLSRRSHHTSDGVTLDVRVAIGTSKSPPVLFVHGWMVSGVVWNPLLDALDVASDRTFVVPDQRGTGRSSMPERGDGAFTLERYGHDVISLADELGFDRFVVVGHSMGAQIAQWVASEHPSRVSGMCLVSPVPLDGLPFPAEARELFATSARDRAKQTAILTMACKALGEVARERLLDDAGTIDDACIRGAFDTFVRGESPTRFAAIRAKTLVVATEDPFLPVDYLKAAIVNRVAGAELSMIAGAGHYPQVEKPKETAALVRRFIESVVS